MCICQNELDLINSKAENLILKIKSNTGTWENIIGMLKESKTILTPSDAVKTAEIMTYETLLHTYKNNIKISSDV